MDTIAENLNSLKERAHDALDQEYDRLLDYAKHSEAFAEFLKYIIEDKVTEERAVGSELLWFVLDICKSNGMAGGIHDSIEWVSCLNSFAGNYFFDDNCFDIQRDGIGTFMFVDGGDVGYQNPMIMIEAAKANCNYRHERGRVGWMTEAGRNLRVDGSKVEELLKNERNTR